MRIGGPSHSQAGSSYRANGDASCNGSASRYRRAHHGSAADSDGEESYCKNSQPSARR